MIYQDIITIEGGKRGGKPTIRGLRITVEDILKMLASGMSFDQIISDYPDLRPEDIKASLLFASSREHGSVTLPHEIAA
jgi:uncharacterized protein (DUF433 family)